MKVIIVLIVLLLTGCFVEKDHLKSETTYEPRVRAWNSDVDTIYDIFTMRVEDMPQLIDSTVSPITIEFPMDSVFTSECGVYKFKHNIWVRTFTHKDNTIYYNFDSTSYHYHISYSTKGD